MSIISVCCFYIHFYNDKILKICYNIIMKNTKTILAVDDSPSWIGFHKNYIEEIFLELDDDYKLDTANSPKEGYNLVMQNNDTPYDLIITDMQMENDFAPDYAGEWLIKQIKTFRTYLNTKIIICSGTYNIKQIAENFSVDYIRKSQAVTDINAYKEKVIENLK